MKLEREDTEYKPVKIVLETQEDFDAFEGLVDAVNADPDFKATIVGEIEEMAIELSNALDRL